MAKALAVIVLIYAFFSLTLAQRRIFNGHEAKEKEFPYMVNMRQANYRRCGGALISNQHVLTAAHCLRDIGEGWHIELALGGWHFEDVEAYPKPNERDPNVIHFFEPMKFWIHENFSMPSAVNDIAIIELPRPVEFTDHIKPIEISADKKIDGAEVVATIMGYGAKQDGSILSETLQKAQVRLIPISDCFQYQPNFVETITMDHICAFGENSTEDHVVSACDGDSGKQFF